MDEAHGWKVAANGLTSWGPAPGAGVFPRVVVPGVGAVLSPVEAFGSYGHRVRYRVVLDFDEGTERMEYREVELRPMPGAALRSEDHRSLPLDRLRRSVVRAAAFQLGEDGRYRFQVGGGSSDAAAAVVKPRPAGVGGGREEMAPEMLREVARVYRGLRGRRAFRAELGRELARFTESGDPASVNTVKNWVEAAKDRTDPMTNQPYLARPSKGRRRGARAS